MKNGEWVFPTEIAVGGLKQTTGGLTKRELFSILALQAVVGNRQLWNSLDEKNTAPKLAVQIADKLIKELGENK